jgi:hypothetical protein
MYQRIRDNRRDGFSEILSSVCISHGNKVFSDGFTLTDQLLL